MNENKSAALAAPAPAAINPKDELVSIYNRGPAFGDFVHPVYITETDAEGRVRTKKIEEYRARPGTFSRVPRWLADLWKKQSPKYIVDSAEIGAPKDHAPTTKEVLELRTENKDMRQRMENMEKLIEQLSSSGKPAK